MDVTVIFRQSGFYFVRYNTPDEQAGTITATVDGKTITSGTLVEENARVVFTATPNENYEIKEWTNNGVLVPNILTNEYVVESLNKNIEVSVVFNYLDITDFMLSKVKIYPNPTTGELRIESGELRIENVEIFDIFGKQQLSTLNSQLSTQKIDISHLSAGLYFVKITTGTSVITQKIIRN